MYIYGVTTCMAGLNWFDVVVNHLSHRTTRICLVSTPIVPYFHLGLGDIPSHPMIPRSKSTIENKMSPSCLLLCSEQKLKFLSTSPPFPTCGMQKISPQCGKHKVFTPPGRKPNFYDLKTLILFMKSLKFISYKRKFCDLIFEGVLRMVRQGRYII